MDIAHRKGNKEIKFHLNILKEYKNYKMKYICKKDTK